MDIDRFNKAKAIRDKIETLKDIQKNLVNVNTITFTNNEEKTTLFNDELTGDILNKTVDGTIENIKREIYDLEKRFKDL